MAAERVPEKNVPDRPQSGRRSMCEAQRHVVGVGGGPSQSGQMEGTVSRWRGLWAGPPRGRVSSGPAGWGRTAKARVQEKVVLGDGDQHEEPTERC